MSWYDYIDLSTFICLLAFVILSFLNMLADAKLKKARKALVKSVAEAEKVLVSAYLSDTLTWDEMQLRQNELNKSLHSDGTYIDAVGTATRKLNSMPVDTCNTTH